MIKGIPQIQSNTTHETNPGYVISHNHSTNEATRSQENRAI